ncbi:hypothetical protein K7X08_030442 [Anisodus acutangulus]|uniref:Uncharacterized protein n=1 Tax=Anisodus acutangulus TaxID=402998 RepID=A0A9Q1L7D2_9SOLA|nr:hypothetical protein K7X08_030442 [Anisodus acutangulus]
MFSYVLSEFLIGSIFWTPIQKKNTKSIQIHLLLKVAFPPMNTPDSRSAISLLINLVSDKETKESLWENICKVDVKIELARSKMKKVDEILEFMGNLAEESTEGKMQYQNLSEEVKKMVDDYVPLTHLHENHPIPYGESGRVPKRVTPVVDEVANHYGTPQGPPRTPSPMWWAIALKARSS